MDDLLQDLRFAIRQMAAKPLLSVLAIVSLALGVGVNSSIFSLVNAVLFRGLPVKDADRVVAVYTSGSDGMPYAPSSFRTSATCGIRTTSWRVSRRTARFIAAFRDGRRHAAALRRGGDRQLFQLLGVRPAVGRSFLPEEDQTPASHPVVSCWGTASGRSSSAATPRPSAGA